MTTHATANLPRTRGRLAIGVSLILHLALALVGTIYYAVKIVPYEKEDHIAVEWVELPEISPREFIVRKILPPPVTEIHPFLRTTEPPLAVASPTMIPEVIHRTNLPVTRTVEVTPHKVQAVLPNVSTIANLAKTTSTVGLSEPVSTAAASNSGRGVETGRVRAAGMQPQRQGINIVNSTGTAKVSIGQPKFTDTGSLVPDNKLGAVLVGEGRDITGHIRIVRVKHSLSDWWQDPTALPSFMAWLRENTRLVADMNFEGGAMSLTDDRILDAPLLVLTGHDKDITVSRNLVREGPLTDSLSDKERANLRRYLLDQGGVLYFDDCGFNGVFAEQIKRELDRILPEYDLRDIPHNHEIYTLYYELAGPPTGGDVFWNSENNPTVSAFRYHKGITINGRLAVVFNRKDYMCAMETAEIPSRTMLRLRRSPDVHRFMTNLLVYAMKYGGNTDRSQYSRR